MKRLALVASLALATQTGCSLAEIRPGGCINMREGDHADVHLYKGGQPVPNDDLRTATADDPEAHAQALKARKDTVLGLVFGSIGIAFTVVGAAFLVDGARGDSNTEIAIFAPMLGVGVAGIVGSAIALKQSATHGQQAVNLYDDHHPNCR